MSSQTPLRNQLTTCKQCSQVWDRLMDPFIHCLRCCTDVPRGGYGPHLKFCRPADMKKSGQEPNQTGFMRNGGPLKGGNW